MINADRLAPLFTSGSIAVIGASRDVTKWGFNVLKHLIDGGFKGHIYPVNPNEDELLGRTVYRDIADIPEKPDLAVVIVPPPAVVQVIRQCVGKGIRSGIVITAGFAELGDEGARLQAEMVAEARKGGMALVGPNCNGVMSPWNRQYVQFPPFFTPPGKFAVVAQSGNVMDVLARQAMLKGLGCSACVASGNEADLHTEDYLEYMGDDPHTRVIMCYTEGFKDGRRFLRVASEVSKKKPIIMVKVGKTQAGARAAASHTASIAGSDRIFDAVCKQAGVIRAGSLDEMLDTAIAFLRQPLPRGRRLGIVTAGGGWGVLAADACAERGFDVVKLPDEVISELDKLLPAWWNRGNPVDLVAGARADNIYKAVEVVMRCPEVDAMAFLSIMPALRIRSFLSPSSEEEKQNWGSIVTEATLAAMEEFNALSQKYAKPLVVASELLFADAVQDINIAYALGQRELIIHHMPHQAARALDALASYSEYLRR